jgi:hypothetical protein
MQEMPMASSAALVFCGQPEVEQLVFAWQMRTLAANLAIAGGLYASFRAGDNFGFHMGSDETQCTCQWSPGHDEPYRGASRCEQELIHEDDDPDDHFGELDE